MKENENSNPVILWIRKISPQVRAVFLSAVLFGLFAQGMALFNKFSHHDDVASLFDVGTTVSSGRWALLVFERLERLLYGTGNTSLPLFNGMLSLLCIGVVGGLLVSLLKIRNKVNCALLGCIMAAFPVVTALFAYMFTSHPYMISLLLMTLCAYLICRGRHWWEILLALCLGGAAVGIYQAFLPFLLTMILLYDIMQVADADKLTGAIIRRIGLQAICIVGVMLVYAAGNQFFLHKYQVELSSYQGIDQMGQMSIQMMLERCGRAYREFFVPTQQVFQDMYPGTLRIVHWLMLIMEVALAIRLIILTGRKGKGQAALLAVLLALVPLGSNLIYLMAENVHGLMVYGQVMQVVLFIWLLDRLEIPRLKLNQTVSLCTSVLLAIMAVMYARYDNQCYLKETLHQQEAISYYTTLVTRIKSQPGYRPEMEVYFSNAENANDPTVYNIDELDFIRLNPYWHNSMEYLHAPTREEFIRVWCGADFSWSWDGTLETRPEVQDMPSYPADGSVQIIDDVVVVKF